MATQYVEVETDGRGRLLLPSNMRKTLGITGHATVSVALNDDGSVVLRDPRADRARRLRAAQGSFAGRGGSVDDLLAERRAEAARENADT